VSYLTAGRARQPALPDTGALPSARGTRRSSKNTRQRVCRVLHSVNPFTANASLPSVFCRALAECPKNTWQTFFPKKKCTPTRRPHHQHRRRHHHPRLLGGHAARSAASELPTGSTARALLPTGSVAEAHLPDGSAAPALLRGWIRRPRANPRRRDPPRRIHAMVEPWREGTRGVAPPAGHRVCAGLLSGAMR